MRRFWDEDTKYADARCAECDAPLDHRHRGSLCPACAAEQYDDGGEG